MTLRAGLFSYEWLSELPGLLLIAFVVLLFWLLGAAAVIGSGGSIAERAQHAPPVAVARDTGQAR